MQNKICSTHVIAAFSQHKSNHFQWFVTNCCHRRTSRFLYDVNSNSINFPSQIVLQFAFCSSKTIHLNSDMLSDADTPCHIIMLQILNLKCKQCLQPCLAWVSEHHYRSNYERSTNFTSILNWLPILVLLQTIYELNQTLKSFSSIRRTFGRWSNLNFSFSHRKK